MKRIIVVLDIMFFISSIFAHPVTSKIAVIMSDEKSTEQFLGNELDLGYPLMVKQTFLFSERLSDSLIFQKNMYIISPSTSTEEEIEYFNIYINGKEYDAIENWHCNNDHIAISLPPNMQDTSIVELQYSVLGLYNLTFLGCSALSSHAMTVHQFEKGNWYFLMEEMEITDVSIQLPNTHTTLLANTNIHQQDSLSYTLEMKNRQFPCGIDFCVLEKDLFDITKANIGKNTNLSMYFLKDQSLNNDSSDSKPTIDKQYRKIQTRQMCKSIKQASRLFQDKEPRTISILHCLYPGGTHCVKGNGHHVILMDTSFFDGRNKELFQHELVHCYMPWVDFADSLYDPNGLFLFVESIPQYFSIYLYYEKDMKGLEHCWQDVYEQLPDSVKEMSIMDATSRQKEQRLVIYYKTPWVIYQFAKKIGFDRFNSIFVKYMQYAKQVRHVSIPELKQVFLENGITEEEWESFATML